METIPEEKWSYCGALVKTAKYCFLPYLIMQVLRYLKEKKYRDCLPGKVVLITGASSGLGEELGKRSHLCGGSETF